MHSPLSGGEALNQRHAYVPELDGLRAVAVLAVLLFHSQKYGPVSGGFVGVDIFFVLSGFLITSILARDLEQRGRIRYGRFYWRRFLRLTPPLLLFLGCYLLIAPLVWPEHDHGRDALLSALYVSDYTYTFWRSPIYLQHTWSLAVEEQFYLVWPILLMLLVRSPRPLAYLALAYLASVAWRNVFIGDWHDYYYRFDTRMSGLILGGIVYFALDRFRFSQAAVWAGAITLAMIITSGTIHSAALYLPPAEIAAALVIGGIVSGNSGALGTLLKTPIAVGLGKLSYGIYLWHYPIAYAIRDTLPFAQTAIIVALSSIALAALSYVTVEAWARSVKSGGAAGARAAPVVPTS